MFYLGLRGRKMSLRFDGRCRILGYFRLILPTVKGLCQFGRICLIFCLG